MNNKYGDEKIVELLNKYKKGEVGDVYTGIYIKGDLYHFKKYSYFENKFNIMLPLRFKIMSNKVAKLKYSGGSLPDIIKTNSDANIDLTFKLIERDFSNEDFLREIESQIYYIKKLQPGYIIFEQKVEKLEDNEVAWYDFRSSTLDNQMYNLTFVMPLDGKMLLGKFNCDYLKAEAWKRVFLKIIYSINSKRTKEAY